MPFFSQALVHFPKLFALSAAMLLLAGCASTTGHGVAFSQPVRSASYADDTLFRDLVNAPGGVAFADRVLYPDVRQRDLVRIEVLAPYGAAGRVGIERWFITHDGEITVSYLVTLTPDGRGGTHFAVRPDQ